MNHAGVRFNADKQLAWRRFVANEGGDFTGDRPWWTEVLNLSEPLGSEYLNRRRRAYPMLTTIDGVHAASIHEGVYLEWDDVEYVPGEGESTDNWSPVHAFTDQTHAISAGDDNENYGGLFSPSHRLLEDQLGVLFTGDQIPRELRSIGNDPDLGMKYVRLRLTCTIRGDRRLADVHTWNARFVAPRHKQFRRVYDGYQYRQVHKTSRFHPQHADYPANITLSRAEVDATVDLHTKTQQLAEDMRHGMIAGTIELNGADYDMEKMLGAGIKKIDGRNIDLSLSPTGAFKRRYPRIVAVTVEPQEQKTTLNLETLQSRA